MLGRKISLGFFKNVSHYYHVYKISSSRVAEVPHHHDFFQICYVACGDIIHKQKNDEVHLVRGDAFIIPPNFTHSIISKNPNAEFYSLSFQEPLFYPGFSNTSANNFLMALKLDSVNKRHIDVRLRIRLDNLERVNMETLFECLLREFQLDLPRDNTMADSLIASILIVLSRAYFAEPGAQQQLSDINEYHESIMACIQYIDQNYMKPLTLPGLARKYALSKSTFGMLFPQIAGMSFKRYLNEKRIEHAVSLSAVESLSYYEIARLVGYKDTSTFYRNFVKVMGISPAEYRKQAQNTDSTDIRLSVGGG
ncbi:MAG TPA: AraC family transcriptional regulator [Firmicutes bacterium]|nr:AraC family transcriptional regulator [Bacillota bacterium]